MIARNTGAFLGLLAFALVTVTGLYQQNPVSVTLSRSILALFFFCVLGLVLGHLAQKVVDEQHRQREADIRKRYRDEAEAPSVGPGQTIGTG